MTSVTEPGPVGNPTTWRDLADRLTPAQHATLADLAVKHGDDNRDLLFIANNYVKANGPLLVGADPAWGDGWEGHAGGVYRLVWSLPLPLGAPWKQPNPGWADNDVRVVVTQFADGTVGTGGDDKPLVYVGQESFSPESARALSAALLAAAGLADQWTGHENVNALLAQARTVVESAYVALRCAPGNTGDYLRAALDSVTDAIEAVQR